MKIGFIGAGNVAQMYARYFVRQGHEIVISNSRGPETLTEVVQSLGPKVRAGTVKEAAMQDIVVLAVRWEKTKQALEEVQEWKGRILIDATNRPIEADKMGKSSGEITADRAPGAKVIKALNTLVVGWVPKPSDSNNRLVLFMSGDDKAAKETLAGLLSESGFEPVDLGVLAEAGRFLDLGAPLSGLQMSFVKRMKS